jgi:uncharacterized damage-inducible protein DinB
MTQQQSASYTMAETWHLNNRVNLRLLGGLTKAQLAATLRPRGKTVASYFAHIHLARIFWLERRARGLAKGLKKVEIQTATQAQLKQALIESGKAMGALFEEAERTGTLKGAKQGPLVFLAYTLAHEAHHRGQIILHLKVAQQPIDRIFGYSLWYWSKI